MGVENVNANLNDRARSPQVAAFSSEGSINDAKSELYTERVVRQINEPPTMTLPTSYKCVARYFFRAHP
jgi:hypothetical protein